MVNNQEKFQERLNRVNKAIRLEQTDRVPLAPFFASWVQRSQGSSYRDIFYDHEAAGKAALAFYAAHPMLDCSFGARFTSGLANEIAQSQMIDWPGRPGTRVPDTSSHQVIEREFMTQEEYPELLRDFTGFMLRKYIPRAFPALKAWETLSIEPTIVVNTGLLAPLYSPAMQESWEILNQIAAAEQACNEVSNRYSFQLAQMGFPSMISFNSEAPYDILGDYFRGTMGIFEDILDSKTQDYVEQACYMLADQQIERIRRFYQSTNLPVRRVFFPLHKAMDGFMSEKQFERLYWKPLKKVILALIDMDVTPYLYTEGPYSSRLETLADVPKGKVLYHFEKVDMKEAKRILGGTACICGNLPISQIEFGKKDTVIDLTKKLLDDCMPGGGYIFDFDGSLENAKEENLEAMFETLELYGKY